MINKTSIAAGVLALLAAVPASALSIGVDASATANAGGASTSVSVSANTKLQNIIAKANSDISARMDALNALNARVQAMHNVSASEKQNISTDVQTNQSGLTTLQGKIDADTDAATAKTDAGTIFTSFRIYALVIPQGWILAASDRVKTITGLMATLETNIQARISADQAAGKDVSAITAAYTDMQAKVSDANTQSASAESGVSGLTPDQGDKTVAASNHTALVAARGDIKTATGDLQAARKDITTILQGLKSIGGPASASASASAAATGSAQ